MKLFLAFILVANLVAGLFVGAIVYFWMPTFHTSDIGFFMAASIWAISSLSRDGTRATGSLHRQSRAFTKTKSMLDSPKSKSDNHFATMVGDFKFSMWLFVAGIPPMLIGLLFWLL